MLYLSFNYIQMAYHSLEHRSPLQPTHAHTEPRTRVADLLPSRDVILPFNLRLNKKALDRKAEDQLFNLFPDTIGVSFLHNLLVFYLASLSPKPWPITIAGIQRYFNTDASDDGPIPPIKRASRSLLRISAERNVANLPPARIHEAF
ncbi:hypothetical protein BDV41DRAFT_540253, partial [Aspergillus transmontanensis]